MPEYRLSIRGPGLTANIDLGRAVKNLELAQRWLTAQVAGDCMEYVPFRNGGGGLRGSITYPKGLEGGVIEWNTPYAHYLYVGEVYVNPKYKRAGWQDNYGVWHGYKGPKVPSGRAIEYHTPGTGDHWYERAKAAHLGDWVNGVKRIVGAQ